MLSKDEESLQDLIKMIWEYSQLLFIIVLALHLLMYPLDYYALQVGVLYKFLICYRLIEIDFAPLMTLLLATPCAHDPTPINSSNSLTSILPSHFRYNGLSEIFFNNYLFSIARIFFMIFLGFITRIIIICLCNSKINSL
jgi:hypothetical protein